MATNGLDGARMRWVELLIEDVPPGLNSAGSGKTRKRGLLGLHWTERRRIFNDWYVLVAQAVGECPVHPAFGLGPVAVTVTRRSRGHMDWDNYGASLKPVLDGLVRAGVVQDDGPAVICRLTLLQEVDSEQSLLIRVERCDAVTPAGEGRR